LLRVLRAGKGFAVKPERASQGYPITAYAACNALGMTSGEALAALYAGRSGLVTGAFDVPFATAVGALPASLPRLPSKLALYDTRLARMALLLADELGSALPRALQRYGADRVAIVVASSTAGLETTERAFAHHLQHGVLPEPYSFTHQHSFGSLIDLLRSLSGARGPGYVVSTACSSGNKVFGCAERLLSAGLADVVLAGGIDTLCQITVRGFHSLGILSQMPCRPFGLGRDGTSIGEGGALLLIERDGQARARLLGVGETCDAHHMTQPLPDAVGAIAAMREALARAGVAASDIDHVNAHGTGTPQNDAAEAIAIATLLGSQVPVASTKGFTGHMLGAAASTEAVFSIAAIERGQLPQSLGASPLDPALQIRATDSVRSARCRYVLSNAFAFGGSNAAVVFGADA
jgi:3-oxoacyl-[acyl-carrier-protein] synthase-1